MNIWNNIEKSAKSIIDICKKKKPTKLDKDKLIECQREIADLIDELVECDQCDAVSDTIATITLNGVTANLCQNCGVKALKAGRIEKRIQQTEKNENEETSQSTENSDATSPDQALKSELGKIPRLPETVIENLANTFDSLQEIANTPVDELQSVEGLGKKRALTIKNELTNRSPQAIDGEETKIDLDAVYTEIQAKTGLKKSEVKRIHKCIDEIAIPMKTDNTISYVASEVDMAKLKIDQSDMEKAVTMLMETKVKRE